MKINWGTALFIVLGVFCLTILSVVIFAPMNQEETSDYYSQDIAANENIHKIKHYNQLNKENKIKLLMEDDGVHVVFPESFPLKDIKGTISLLRYSDENKDKEYQISETKDNYMLLAKSDLTNGTYRIKIDYKNTASSYLMIENFTWK